MDSLYENRHRNNITNMIFFYKLITCTAVLLTVNQHFTVRKFENKVKYK